MTTGRINQVASINDIAYGASVATIGGKQNKHHCKSHSRQPISRNKLGIAPVLTAFTASMRTVKTRVPQETLQGTTIAGHVNHFEILQHPSIMRAWKELSLIATRIPNIW